MFSSIKILFRMSDQKFLIEEQELDPTFCLLQAGLAKEAPVQTMDRVSFGYALLHAGDVLSEKSWPPPGVKYVQTDQEILETDSVNYPPDRDLTLHVWLDYAGNHFEYNYDFHSPRPDQPYSSWTWDGEKWNPPVPYPDNGNDYIWDEENQQWVIPAEPVDINTTDFDTLRDLNGVDEVRAQAIIDGRPWADVNDLTTIQGISQEMVDSWEVTV